jgi:hypothetical protein
MTELVSSLKALAATGFRSAQSSPFDESNGRRIQTPTGFHRPKAVDFSRWLQEDRARRSKWKCSFLQPHDVGRKNTIQSYVNHNWNARRRKKCHAKAQRRKEKKNESNE